VLLAGNRHAASAGRIQGPPGRDALQQVVVGRPSALHGRPGHSGCGPQARGWPAHRGTPTSCFPVGPPQRSWRLGCWGVKIRSSIRCGSAAATQASPVDAVALAATAGVIRNTRAKAGGRTSCPWPTARGRSKFIFSLSAGSHGSPRAGNRRGPAHPEWDAADRESSDSFRGVSPDAGSAVASSSPAVVLPGWRPGAW